MQSDHQLVNQLERVGRGEHVWSVLASALERRLPRDALLGLPEESDEDGAEDGGAVRLG
jgi:hypothetical protein